MFLEDGFVIMVETDDHACGHLNAVRLYMVNLFEDRPYHVHVFSCLHKRFVSGGFDPDEKPDKTRIVEELEKFVIVGNVERRFGVENHRVSLGDIPFPQGDKKFLCLLPVPGEVVIDEENPSSAQTVNLFDFCQDLWNGLGSGAVSQHYDDIAKLAIVRAATAELDGLNEILVHF